jgi:hypothetical protein
MVPSQHSNLKPSSQNDSGFLLERIFDDQIIVITIKDSSRETIDSWIDAIIKLVETWPADKPVFAIQDFSQRKTGPTPYSRARAKETTSTIAKLNGYVAMVLPTTFIGQLIRIFYRNASRLNVKRGNMVGKVFTDREKAIGWLKEMIVLEAERTKESTVLIK